MGATREPTINEMRQRIRAATGGRDRVDGKPMSLTQIAPASALIHACLMFAEREGWSGDDTMTFLAYHALISYECMHDRVIEWAHITPIPSLVVDSSVLGVAR